MAEMPCIADLSNDPVHLDGGQGVGDTAAGVCHEQANVGHKGHHRIAWNPFHSESMIASRRKEYLTLQCDNSSALETQQ